MTTVTLATPFFGNAVHLLCKFAVFLFQKTCVCGCIAIYLVIWLLTSGPVIHLKCSVTDGNRSSARHCPVFVIVVVLFDTKVQIIINSSYPSYLFSHPTHRTFLPVPTLFRCCCCCCCKSIQQSTVRTHSHTLTHTRPPIIQFNPPL